MDAAIGDGQHFDLLVTDDDIHFDGVDSFETTDARPSIAQDIVHAIRESMLLNELIAQRDFLKRKSIYVQIETLVEADDRIVPGTATVSESDSDGQSVWIQANTYDYQGISFYL